jgi:hypothetical protein
MVVPLVLPWVKQTNFSIGFRIDSTDTSSLAKIAGTTSESEIEFGISAASIKGYDMFDFKRKVEDQFWSMTIFTTMSSTASD